MNLSPYSFLVGLAGEEVLVEIESGESESSFLAKS